MLIQLGRRLREQLGGADLLARLGGDQFAVLLGDASPAQAWVTAQRLRTALTDPFAIAGMTLHADASIGIALFPEHGCELSGLLRRADIAMYRAKTTRAGYSVFSGVDDSNGEQRFRLSEELRTALDHDQLTVHYQPKIDLATGEVHGVEALVRWDHPTRGLLYPDAFLTLVEDTGLMGILHFAGPDPGAAPNRRLAGQWQFPDRHSQPVVILTR